MNSLLQCVRLLFFVARPTVHAVTDGAVRSLLWDTHATGMHTGHAYVHLFK